MAIQTFERAPALMFIEKMLAALAEKRMTRAEMQHELFASKTKVLNYVRYLHGDSGQPKRIYVCGYEQKSTGGRNPRYSVGNRPDAKPPRQRTEADRFAAIKADPERHARRKAKLRAKAASKRSLSKPHGPFAALGL